MTANIDTVRAGLDAYKRGDFDAVAELLAPDVRWEGVGGADPCVNREEALSAMRAGAERAKDLELADAVPFGTDKVMVCLVRVPGDETDENLPPRVYNVVTFAGDKVARMQGFLGRKEAVQAARGTDAADGGGESAPKAKQKQGTRKRPLSRRIRMAVGRALGR
jgi:ketosteroid isomerase-like protein